MSLGDAIACVIDGAVRVAKHPDPISKLRISWFLMAWLGILAIVMKWPHVDMAE
jgi:hypothetical protein